MEEFYDLFVNVRTFEGTNLKNLEESLDFNIQKEHLT